ncbi:putative glutamate--tRNA ligase, mitochondrial-like Protein [Tribolium castaneum]|uniref:Nondiscriminating glutamyl-tRNA synthetase EARS2, mitochondrial n=1 Tax=Tribolium castaneum TaxID=7070 RepID=D6WN97_TRICA|nr:putative glutamate--tRNA ligase, mitochondrial-like Protein [Tribolium castaneum]
MQSFTCRSFKTIKKIPVIVRFYAVDNREAVRVRFAPSPTGFLHLGGLRTALYNYFFAKSCNGAFILRIEDTDQSRLVEGAIEQLQHDLNWAGIQIDEGPSSGGSHGPYIQSQRLHIYREHVTTLLNNGSAYHCFCTEKRLELLRREAIRIREIPKYDNRCRSLKPEEVEEKLAQGIQSCVRFKLAPGVQNYADLIYGSLNYDVAANEGDPVIVKSDGFPTYHFANVVDDHLMKVSHVLRGVEWQISTPKHIMMYRAFGWEPPLFGHLPLLMNPDGSKLSKRQGDIRIGHYRDLGIFPLALINFITNSGGGFEKDSEQNVKPKCYTMDELARQNQLTFGLELKRKLEDPNEEKKLVEEVGQMVRKSFAGNDLLQLDPQHVRYILHWSVNRITKLQDLLSDDLKFIWVSPKSYQISENDLVPLGIFIEQLERNQTLDREHLNAFFKSFCKEHQLKFGNFMKTLRSILSGLKEGPSVAEMVEILGKDNTIRRLQHCIKHNK